MLKESRNNTKYDNLMDAALNYVTIRGFQEIKSTTEGYDQPFQYTMQDKSVTFTPDITAKNRDKKHYFEIAQRTDDPTYLASKWKLLATLAEMKKGKFTILVPYGQNKFTEQLVMQHEIEAELVKLDV